MRHLQFIPLEQMKQNQIRKEQRPFAFNILKHAQLPSFVIESGAILLWCSITIAQESFASVLPLEPGDNCLPCGCYQLGIIDGERRETNDRKQSGIKLFAVRFSRQHRLQHSLAFVCLIGQHMDHASRTATGSEQIQFIHCLEGCFRHTN